MNLLIRLPNTYLTIGALSLLFVTNPIDVLLGVSSAVNSYLSPVYLFLDININGQNVFSYSKS